MATRKRRQRIMAPRKPRGEDPKVTISNQERQIKLLIDRCQALEEKNHRIERNIDDMNDAEEWADEVHTAYIRLLGWQDCIRELLGARFEPFPSDAPGS